MSSFNQKGAQLVFRLVTLGTASLLTGDFERTWNNKSENVSFQLGGLMEGIVASCGREE